MQIEDQSFIHDGDFFLNRFPSFSENQSWCATCTLVYSQFGQNISEVATFEFLYI